MPLRSQNPSPFEYCLAAGSLLAGILIFATDSIPASLKETASVVAQVTWGILFTTGALSVLIGLSKKDRADGLLIESVGLVMLSAGTGTYAIVVGLAQSAPLNACIFGSLAVACIWRYVQITIWMRNRQD